MSVIAKMSIRSVTPFGVGRAVDLSCVAANDMMAGFAEGKSEEDRLFSKASPSGDMRVNQPANSVVLGKPSHEAGFGPDTHYVMVLFGDEAHNRPCKGAWAVVEATCYAVTEFGGTSIQVEFRDVYTKTARTVGIDRLHWRMMVDNPGAQRQFNPGEVCIIAFYPADSFTRDTAIAAAHAGPEETADETRPEVRACFCIGPRPGETLCPCRLRNESDKDRQIRLLQIEVERLRRGARPDKLTHPGRRENGIERMARLRRVLDVIRP